MHLWRRTTFLIRLRSNRASALELSSPKLRFPMSPARGTIFSLTSFWKPASPCFSRRVLNRSFPSTCIRPGNQSRQNICRQGGDKRTTAHVRIRCSAEAASGARTSR